MSPGAITVNLEVDMSCASRRIRLLRYFAWIVRWLPKPFAMALLAWVARGIHVSMNGGKL